MWTVREVSSRVVLLQCAEGRGLIMPETAVEVYSDEDRLIREVMCALHGHDLRDVTFVALHRAKYVIVACHCCGKVPEYANPKFQEERRGEWYESLEVFRIWFEL